MRTKLQVIALLLLFCLVASEKTTLTRRWTPGVAKGDYFYFEMYGVYTSNRPDVKIAIPQFEYNNTDWTRINITNVEGSIVYQVYTTHFKNGSELNFNFKTDVNPANRSSLNFYEKGVPICAANLAEGDFIPTAELTINDTIVRGYQNGLRETNHAAWNYSDDWGNCYFDKETGMLVELCRTHKFTSKITDEVVEKTDVIKLIISNRLEMNESVSKTLFVSTVTIFLLAFLIVVYKVVSKTCNRLIVNEMVN